MGDLNTWAPFRCGVTCGVFRVAGSFSGLGLQARLLFVLLLALFVFWALVYVCLYLVFSSELSPL